MPTENRSSNTEMVSVPEGFMLVERSIWTEQQVEAATACITRLKGVPGMRDCDLAMAAIDAAQCKAPDIALSDLLPGPQPHPDPIAWMVGTAFWWTKEEAERDAAETGLPIVGLGPMACAAPAEQHQGEPVARVEVGVDRNACLTITDNDWLRALKDKVNHQVVPLYTHSEPAEVERLTRKCQNADLALKAQTQNCDNLRTQLADLKRRYDRLHRDMATIAGREVSRGCTVADYAAAAIADALSASAEPSAPECGHAACKSLGEPHPFCHFVKGLEQAEPSAPVEIDADQIALDCAASVMDLLEGSLPPSPNKWAQLKAAVQCRVIAALKRKQ